MSSRAIDIAHCCAASAERDKAVLVDMLMVVGILVRRGIHDIAVTQQFFLHFKKVMTHAANHFKRYIEQGYKQDVSEIN